MTAILFILLFGLILVGVPVYVSLVLSSVGYMLFFTSLPLDVVAQRVFSGIDKFSLIAIPCFILAANVMRGGGLSRRIVQLASALVGHLPGGLALTTILACMFFGAVSGSSPATVVAIGAIMLPALVKEGYPSNYSVGLITASAAVALIIPPSIGMIVYGTVTGVSVGDLFMAGVGPGIVFGIVFMVYAYIFAKKHNLVAEKRASWGELWTAIKEAGWAIGIPVVVIGGIYGGIFTPTEAAAVAAVYAIFVALVIYRELDLKGLMQEAIDSAVGTAQIMILIGAASVFAWLLTRLQLPQEMAEMLTSFSDSKIVILLMMNVILLISGMFIDPTSITMIFAPLFLPLALKFGIDPVHLGIIIVVNGAIGMYTPPFGFNLFVASSVSKLSIDRLVPAVMPFILLSLITLAIVTFVPQVSLWLPSILR